MDHDGPLDRDAAAARLRGVRAEVLADTGTEAVDLADAPGRTLAEPVVAEGDRPPADEATMDGFALAAADDGPYRIVEEVFPEDDPPSIGEREAVRIATGAPLPGRADAVLMREDATVEDGRLADADLEPGTNVHPRGASVKAGEELFAAGERLAPRDAVLLRDLGVEPVEVHEPISAGVLATGTEIHEGRSPDRDSPMLCGLVRSWDGRATYEGSVPDDYDAVEERIAALADEHDAVLTTGGTSVGRKDYTIRALDALGEVLFRGVRLRPGRPVTVADLPEHGAVAVALPGKPLSAHCAATLVARDLFAGEDRLAAVEAAFARDVAMPGDLEYAVPVALSGGEAMPLGHADSALSVYRERFRPGRLASNTRATRADAFVLTGTDLTAGETVRAIPYPVVE